MEKTDFEIKQELSEFHQDNVKKYVGKSTNKGTVEKIEYLTFDGNSGGNYSDLPKPRKKGLVCARIGNKSIPIGELIFTP